MPLLDLLPHETVVYILALAGPISIKTFRQVSRSYWSIVLESTLLGYIVALYDEGYSESLVPRTDINTLERMHILEQRRARRHNSEGIPHFQIQVPVPGSQRPGVNFAHYHNGVYVHYHRSVQILHVYQLPSVNYGIETSREWQLRFTSPTLVELATYAELDLMVWLQALHSNPFEAHPNTNQEYRYKVHLRSLLTNGQHPDATSDSIVYDFTAPRTITTYTIHIIGNILAIHFISIRERFNSRVVVWDWTTGIQTMLAATPGGNFASFALISEDLFVVTRSSSFFQENARIRTGTYGQLDIYRLQKAQEGGDMLHTWAHPILRLSLPNLARRLSESSIKIRKPNYSPPSSYVSASSRPKIYDLLPRNQMLCVDIMVRPTNRATNGPGPHGTLMVSTKTLLQAARPFCDGASNPAEPHEPARLSWPDWAQETYWGDASVIDVGTPHSASGRLYAQLDMHPDPLGGFTICRFDQPAQEALGPREGAFVGFLDTSAVPRLGGVTMIDIDASFLPLDSVILDDEYVIAQSRWEDAGYTLLVYCF